MTFSDAKASVLSYRRRLETIAKMMRDQPGLVRVATDGKGDRIAFWFANNQEQTYNVSDAERRIEALAKQFGQDILRSRSGQIVKIELPLG